VFCGIRLGGMGVAIGSTIGNELANKIWLNYFLQDLINNSTFLFDNALK
jgi:hypothetical protein